MTEPAPSSPIETKPAKPKAAAAFQYAGLGLQYSLTLLVFAAGGWWLDERWGTSPWLLITGVFLGFLGATISLVARVGGTSARRSARAKSPGSSSSAFPTDPPSANPSRSTDRPR